MNEPIIKSWTFAQSWRAAGLRITGRIHQITHTPSQDSWSISTGTNDTPALSVIAVSDGASTASRGELGARIISRFAARWLARTLSGTRGSITEDKLVEGLTSALHRRIELWDREGFPAPELAGTFAAIVGWSFGKWIACGIGDTVVAGDFGASTELVIPPTRGEFANETCFATDRNARQHLRVSGSAAWPRCESLMIFTDGLNSVFLNEQRQTLTGAAAKALRWIQSAGGSDISDRLSRNAPFLANRSSDDLTLVLLRPPAPQD